LLGTVGTTDLPRCGLKAAPDLKRTCGRGQPAADPLAQFLRARRCSPCGRPCMHAGSRAL
jgi:hypothetical protein